MDNKLKYGAMGIAVLFVFAMVALPGSAADRVELPVPKDQVAGSCELTLPGDSCESEIWIYDGSLPALDTTDTLIGAGDFIVRIQETCCESFYFETTFTAIIVAGEVIVSAEAHDTEFSPWVGWPVTTQASALGAALPSVTATTA